MAAPNVIPVVNEDGASVPNLLFVKGLPKFGRVGGLVTAQSLLNWQATPGNIQAHNVVFVDCRKSKCNLQ
jgi:hypothetical protein